MDGDEAFYYLHQDSKHQGAVLTHVDDFLLAGTLSFLDGLETEVGKILNVSKVE